MENSSTNPVWHAIEMVKQHDTFNSAKFFPRPVGPFSRLDAINQQSSGDSRAHLESIYVM